MKSILQVAAVALLAFGTGAAAVGIVNPDVPDFAVPEGAWEEGTALDGRSFGLSGVIVESGRDLPETILSFQDGKFQSSRCQIYCDFGWNTYQTKRVGEVIHFTATTQCPDAPHTVVWYGTVEGDDMQVAGTWTTRRWYWTQQLTMDATGLPAAAATATGEG